ncbi:MAG: hypothetical protein JNL67_10205 [Planctomycetaceae bacterium]|nr:hypothetical protein [Planctomycetaceae bacterium]
MTLQINSRTYNSRLGQGAVASLIAMFVATALTLAVINSLRSSMQRSDLQKNTAPAEEITNRAAAKKLSNLYQPQVDYHSSPNAKPIAGNHASPPPRL